MRMVSNMALDLPIEDIIPYIDDAMEQIGVPCLIDEVPTKIMISDLQRSSNGLQANIKLAVVGKGIVFDRGSSVFFTNENQKAIVFTEPVDDIVSYSCQMLKFNSKILIEEPKYTQYDENTGDIIYQENTSITKEFDGYCEKSLGSMSLGNNGRMSAHELVFTTHANPDLEINQKCTLQYSGSNLDNFNFRIDDIDDLTSGIYTIKLVSL